MNASKLFRPVAFLLVSVLMACSSTPGPQTTLYTRLGGMAQITQIVNETVDRTSKDPRTKRNFDGINLPRTKASVATHLCAIAGGPCKYEGENMTVAHTGMQISSLEFDVMDGYLGEALDRRGIDSKTKQEVQRLLSPMKPEIIEK